MESSRFDRFTRKLASRQQPDLKRSDQERASPVAALSVQTGGVDALVGKSAPEFRLPDFTGGLVSLSSLLTAGKPVLLVFVDPRCGPCYEILPDLGGWQRVYGDRLTVALISSGDAETNRAMISNDGIKTVLLQKDQEVVHAFNLTQAPAAVVIGTNGRISAGPRFGTQAIRQVVAETLGLVLPPEPARVTFTLNPGDAAPSLRLPDLSGNVVDLRARHGQTTLLLFWSPTCPHCASLLPDILDWEANSTRPGLIVISRGTIGANRTSGFTSPVVIDETGRFGDTLGVTGTPAAVLVNEVGQIASPVVGGATMVRSLLAKTLEKAPGSTGTRNTLLPREGIKGK